MQKNVHTVYYNSTKDQQSDFVLHNTLKSVDEQLLGLIKTTIKDDLPLIIVDAKAHLPPHWQTRLIQPLLDDPQVMKTCALNTTDQQLSPLAAPFSGSLAQLDQAVFLLQNPQYFISSTTNLHCFAVRHVGCLSDSTLTFAVNNLVVDEPQNKEVIDAPKAQDIGDQRPLPAHPLAKVQMALSALSLEQLVAGYPGLDHKPVMLHLVMDWGGGVHKWVNDFIHDHDDMNHLILSSQGEFFRKQQGEKFFLHWQHTNGPALREFDLAAPIIATTTTHPEYQAMLAKVIDQWNVQSLVISSLIGHAMDCLKTTLPTIRVLHDYFPHWPSLNARLDDETIENAAIKQALKDTQQEPLGPINAEQLNEWQQTTNQLLSQEHVTIVAPDESVKLNLQKLPHATCYAKTTVIPHASQALQPLDYQASKDPFTVLVLGRISPPKGQALLQQCISSLQDDESIKFVLLGAGINGAAFTDYPNTQVINDFRRDEFESLVAQISPQLGLLTSITAETFSYTLSELQSLGLPVLATAVGALKNRIEHNKNGVLVQPVAASIIENIKSLQQDPEGLIQLHEQALATKQVLTKDNKQAYAKLLNQIKFSSRSYRTHGLVTPSPLANALWQAQQTSAQLSATLQTTEQNLDEKVKWAKGLDKHNQHLAHNIDLERQENQKLHTAIEEQVGMIEALEQTVEKVRTTLNQTSDELREEQALNSLLSSEKAQLTEQVQAMLNSRSWRITKPLRSFTTYARHKRNALKFRLNQLKSLPRRVRNSLKTRGVKQTALMAKNKLKKPTSQAKVTAHSLDENFQDMVINASPEPIVSVVVPVYNHYKHTYHCLQSLAQLTDQTPFEVIVIDDCSTDETPTAIKQVKGITYHRQPKNGGFIQSCNTGADLAKGEYLLFLNNDTEVLEGWLDELVQTFATQPEAGLVGSQLLYPDGRLQEAGGIVFSDASGWNYGRLESPDAPEYQHLREATYISGASIMISKAMFNELGQFDERYKPAYYEDTDLAFSVRKAGKKVFYQPLSRVIHFEGVSSGTDLSSGTKKYQVINQQKFSDKWQAELKTQPDPGTDIELARLQNQPSRVLILDACTPTPDQDSGSLRMINLMQIFIELGYHVSFIPENMAFFDAYSKELQRLGVECVYAPKYSSPLDYLKAKGGYFELVILSRYYVAEPVMPMIRSYCPKAKVWFDTVDLHYLREARMAELDDDSAALKAAKNTKLKEYAVAEACDLTLVVSPYEQQVMSRENSNLDVAVLSNIHEIYGGHVGHAKSQDIMFIGGYQHTPNVDGIIWFVEEILPQICAAIPELKLHIIGSKAPQQVQDLAAHPNVEFHGFVTDIAPLMQTIRLAVAPLRFGAGVKGKVNMSMSYGQPVVGTSVAVEGMYTRDGHDVLMADDAAGFAAAVIQLYEDQNLWQQVSQGGLENVEKWFSFTAAKNTIAELLRRD